MIRLLIVDDEHHIVNYLASLFVEQLEIDFDVYKAYSGLDALEILEKIKIDIILLDINMPLMSGLDVAKKVSGIWPKCRVIFLTAHGNFNYIYEAGKQRNTSYLLKTESDETILAEVKLVVQSIEDEAKHFLHLSVVKQKEMLLTHLLQQNILKEILFGQDISKLKNQVSLIGQDFILNLHEPVYIMFMQICENKIEDYNKSISERNLKYIQLMQQLLYDKFLFSMVDLNMGIIVWFYQPIEQFSLANSISSIALLKGMAEDFVTLCNSSLDMTITLLLCTNALTWNHVPSTYNFLYHYTDAQPVPYSQKTSLVIYLDENEIRFTENIEAIPKISIDKLNQEISFHLYQGQPMHFFVILDKLHKLCPKAYSMNNLFCVNIYLSIALLLIKYIDQYNLSDELLQINTLYSLYHIGDFQNWDDAFNYIKKVAENIFELLSSKKADKNELIVKTIKEYINNNISESLTLAKISEIVCYNKSYVSRMFKQVSGMGLSEYINQIRLEKAKELLVTTNIPIQSIATKTGFDTSQYFSSVFKKALGLSPKEFRSINNHLNH